MRKGFTLIELVVVVAIVATLSAVIAFSVSLYSKKSKDSNIFGNLSILVPAGEAYYNGNNSYSDFCSSSVWQSSLSQILNLTGVTPYCYANADAWSACAQELSDATKAYCVDSRGVKEEITFLCDSGWVYTQCP